MSKEDVKIISNLSDMYCRKVFEITLNSTNFLRLLKNSYFNHFQKILIFSDLIGFLLLCIDWSMYECRIGSTLGHLSVSDREITVLSFFRSHLLPLQYSLIRAILGNMSVIAVYLYLFEPFLFDSSFIHSS